MMYGNQWGWNAMMLMPVVWIALVAIIVWAVVRLTRTTNHDRATTHEGSSREGPKEILDRRLASGEVDAATYTQIRDQLAGRNPGSS